jgi:hypothetical protein
MATAKTINVCVNWIWQDEEVTVIWQVCALLVTLEARIILPVPR